MISLKPNRVMFLTITGLSLYYGQFIFHLREVFMMMQHGDILSWLLDTS
jgi:hypothetical protein